MLTAFKLFSSHAILRSFVSYFFYDFRPRLGSALPKILACGLLFFILASIEGCFRAFSVSIDLFIGHCCGLVEAISYYIDCSCI